MRCKIFWLSEPNEKRNVPETPRDFIPWSFDRDRRGTLEHVLLHVFPLYEDVVLTSPNHNFPGVCEQNFSVCFVHGASFDIRATPRAKRKSDQAVN